MDAGIGHHVRALGDHPRKVTGAIESERRVAQDGRPLREVPARAACYVRRASCRALVLALARWRPTRPRRH